MKERPIIFSSEEVRATLSGRKTQFRRGVKDTGMYAIDASIHGEKIARKELIALASRCPYSKIGGRLWVRETWWHPEPYGYILPSGDYDETKRMISQFAPVHYDADGNPPSCANSIYGKSLISSNNFFSAPDPFALWTKRPSIHMPRWASRITLEITNVRVERIQDISEEDAIAEGVLQSGDGAYCGSQGFIGHNTACSAFLEIWDSKNAKRGFNWDSNPWVWVAEFKRIK